MISAHFKLGTLLALLLAAQAQAVGFGEITLHSRVGEPLRAEVPILLAGGETVDTACFSLAPLPGSDLPVVSRATTKLVHDGNTYRLLLTGNKPIAEPVFMIGLRADCGFDLQRDYVLMPGEPLMTAEVAAPPVAVPAMPPAKQRSRKYSELSASDGDTLESIAEALAPDDMVRRQRTLAALKRANPELMPGQPLAAGDIVRVPNTRQVKPAESASPSPMRQPRPSRAIDQPAPLAAERPASAKAAAPGSGDRIVLGAPSEDFAGKADRPPPRGSIADMEERMLRLETTLHQLNQEVDKLNKVLELTTETIAAQQKLQLAQALQNRAADAGALPTSQAAPTGASPATRDNWLELLFSALLGGGIAAGLAHLLGRHRRQPTLQQLTGQAASAPPSPVPAADAAAAAPASFLVSLEPLDSGAPASPAVDIPLDGLSSAPAAAAVAVEFNETTSALELAEIMLCYGRVKGAAETLAQHIEENAPDNIQPWLMLLDLYRRGNLRPEFDHLSQRIRDKFNMHMPDWAASTTPVSGLKALEDYAHITWRLVDQWGKQECLDYLYDLIHDNRAGQRFGFPLEIVEEIALLMRVLEDGYGLRRPA